MFRSSIKTHLEYVSPFSAMDETTAYITCHPIPPKNPVQWITGRIVNKTRNLLISGKLIDIIVICFFSYKINSWMCI